MTHSPDYLKGRADGRAEALEEAARVADEEQDGARHYAQKGVYREYNTGREYAALHIAAAIRALKKTPR